MARLRTAVSYRPDCYIAVDNGVADPFNQREGERAKDHATMGRSGAFVEWRASAPRLRANVVNAASRWPNPGPSSESCSTNALCRWVCLSLPQGPTGLVGDDLPWSTS